MSAVNKARSGVAPLRAAMRIVSIATLSALSLFGCAQIIGLGDYTVASSGGSGSGAVLGDAGGGGEAGEGKGGFANIGGANDGMSDGGVAGEPGGLLGCDGRTPFTPNLDVVTSCLVRAGCDPSFSPLRTVSQCVTYNTQAALPGESCNLDSTDCSGFEQCEHVGIAHDDLCGGSQVTRCENGKAINCGNYQGADRFFDCTAFGATCNTYTYSNDLVYADCAFDVGAGACLDPATKAPLSDDTQTHCGTASNGVDVDYYCYNGKAYGSSCTSLGHCTTSKATGKPGCFFDTPTCGADSSSCGSNESLNVCADGGLFKYSCGGEGLTCSSDGEGDYCLAPGCTSDEIDNCVESCSDDGTTLNFCYGGSQVSVTCTDFGFTQCLSDTDDDGNTFAACRF